VALLACPAVRSGGKIGGMTYRPRHRKTVRHDHDAVHDLGRHRRLASSSPATGTGQEGRPLEMVQCMIRPRRSSSTVPRFADRAEPAGRVPRRMPLARPQHCRTSQQRRPRERRSNEYGT
jgi:hypothetical protein